MKRILVTGACGSVGEALVSRLLDNKNIVCAFDNSEDNLFSLNQRLKGEKRDKNLRIFIGDVRDEGRLTHALNGVDEVYHCAALKHVELSEYNPFEALNTNVLGTNNVINASIKNRVKKVLLTSSDKAVNPSSTMGATKLLAEKLLISANNFSGSSESRFGCLRFGNVWNTNGSVARIFQNQTISSQDITLTSKEMTRFFLTLENAVDLCINSCDSLIGGETFISDMGAASIGEIANEFIKYNKKIKVVETGLKPGEKLYEELFTDIESERTYRYKDMYVILPDSINHISDKYQELMDKYRSGQPIGQSLRSDSEFAESTAISDLVDPLMNEC